MKTCVVYISHTGNTKRLAEAISDSLQVPLFDLATASVSEVANFDLLVLGTPVTGSKPAPEVLAFLNRLPQSSGKKAILFCTYAVFKGGTLKIMEKALSAKGYSTILQVSKKGVKPTVADFSDVLVDITRAVREQAQRAENR
ncbi:MAG: flavodoxin family protein [Candidatus Bathyarchaeia archaeon]